MGSIGKSEWMEHDLQGNLAEKCRTILIDMKNGKGHVSIHPSLAEETIDLIQSLIDGELDVNSFGDLFVDEASNDLFKSGIGGRSEIAIFPFCITT